MDEKPVKSKDFFEKVGDLGKNALRYIPLAGMAVAAYIVGKENGADLSTGVGYFSDVSRLQGLALSTSAVLGYFRKDVPGSVLITGSTATVAPAFAAALDDKVDLTWSAFGGHALNGFLFNGGAYAAGRALRGIVDHFSK